jgi:hypothetical protein
MFSRAERELRRRTAHWAEVEQKNFALTSLYVALHQLHGALTRSDVVEALTEIVVGLIGSESLAIYERGGDGMFRAIAALGVDADDLDVDALLASGVRHVDGPVAAALPLAVGGRVVGGIVIASLLPQKSGFTAADFELFDVLSAHGAIALCRTAGVEVAA